MNDYVQEYQHWLDSPALTEVQWKELKALEGNDKEIESRFYAPLEFGTAGLRGIMGMGINRMNEHVIKHTTQAFAEVICAEGEAFKSRGVVICYDCRENSEYYSRCAATVMAANGIHVRIFDSLRPTPELSFAIRHYGAAAGINVTASHNPKEYNGYKVYWSDGAQLPPKHAEMIEKTRQKIDMFTDVKSMKYSEAQLQGLVETIGAETDEAFLEQVLGQSIAPEVILRHAEELRIVYTPFHGAGYKLVPEALKRIGVLHLIPVPEQMVIDGAFPTVKSPNPENTESFAMAIELAKREKATIIIGTDPDSDRIGVMAPDSSGDYTVITGNQLGVLLLDYILSARKRADRLPENAAALKSIVTTDMARAVADSYGVHMDDTFTGFKFMAEKIAEYEKNDSYSSVFAFEESYGYMIGDFVRDKDAVTASVMVSEMTAYYLDKGMSLFDALNELYKKHGYYYEKTLNLVMPGIDGLEKMKRIMNGLRSDPPREIDGVSVLRYRDYETGEYVVPGIGVVDKTEIAGSNVLFFEMEDKSSFIVRPSGTEPKIKVYILARGESGDDCLGKIATFEKFANDLGK